MNSRPVLNLVLLGLVSGLGLLVYFQPGVDETAQAPPLTSLTPDSVERIYIERSGNESVTINKLSTGWQLSAPIEVAANSVRINSLLELTQASSHSRFAADKLELDQYKLADSPVQIRFNDIEIVFGNIEPINNRRYVLIGQMIHLISDRYYYQLHIQLPNFVDLNLMPRNARIKQISLPEFDIKRSDDGIWFVNPQAGDISADRINQLMAEWQRAQAMQVSAYQGENNSDEKITIIHDQGELAFDIIEREPELILGRSDIGMRYHLPTEQGLRLLQLSSAVTDDDDLLDPDKTELP